MTDGITPKQALDADPGAGNDPKRAVALLVDYADSKASACSGIQLANIVADRLGLTGNVQDPSRFSLVFPLNTLVANVDPITTPYNYYVIGTSSALPTGGGSTGSLAYTAPAWPAAGSVIAPLYGYISDDNVTFTRIPLEVNDPNSDGLTPEGLLVQPRDTIGYVWQLNAVSIALGPDPTSDAVITVDTPPIARVPAVPTLYRILDAFGNTVVDKVASPITVGGLPSGILNQFDISVDDGQSKVKGFQVTSKYSTLTGVFLGIVTDPASGTGTGLTVDTGPAPALADLTALGTTDWSHFGIVDQTSYESKSGGTELSNVTNLIGSPIRYGGDSDWPTVNWTDGTPTASATTQSILYWTSVNNGYSFTCVADTTERTLVIYAGEWNCVGQMSFTLSDASSPDVSVSVDSNGITTVTRYVITFTAGSAAQTLTATHSMATDYGGGNVALQAVYVQTAGGPAAQFLLEVDFNNFPLGQVQDADVIPAFQIDMLGYNDDQRYWSDLDIVQDPTSDGHGQVLRLFRAAGWGWSGPPAGGMGFRADFTPQEDVYLAYWMYLAPNHEYMRQQKNPGFITGTTLQASHEFGVTPTPEGLIAFAAILTSDGNDAWSRGDGAMSTYFYDADEVQRNKFWDRTDPTNDPSSPTYDQYLQPAGRWIEIEERILMNTVTVEGVSGLQDGKSQCWVKDPAFNGGAKTLVADFNHRWRLTNSMKIDGLWMVNEYGGDGDLPANQPANDQYHFYDHFRISTSPILV